MTKSEKIKMVIFGPWLEKKEGEVKPTKEGKLVQEWLSGKSIDELGLWANVNEFEGLLRKEMEAQIHFLELVTTELKLLRNDLLDQANAPIPDLSNPGATLIEAYNNGVNMGKHWKPIELSQRIADTVDKYHLEKMFDGSAAEND